MTRPEKLEDRIGKISVGKKSETDASKHDWLLDENGNIAVFDDKAAAIIYLKSAGETDENIKDLLFHDAGLIFQ